MKRLILIFIFISGINLFASSTNFILDIYIGEANYLDGYNQYLPSAYYVFNYRLHTADEGYLNIYKYEKQYIYDYVNKKMYLIQDYYFYLHNGRNSKRDEKVKYYDLNGKQVQTKYEFKNVTGTNRFGEIQIGHDSYDYYNYGSIAHSSSDSESLLHPLAYGYKEYKHSLKQPNIIDAKNMGLYIHIGVSSDYGFYEKYKECILALGCEYHTADSIRDENYYEYSGKDYIFLTNKRRDRDTYHIIDLETKSKLSINDKNVISKEKYEERLKEKEEKIAELEAEPKNMRRLEILREYKANFIKDATAIYMRKGYSKEKAEATAKKAWENGGDTAHAQRELNSLEYELEKNKKDIEELKSEVEELKKIKKDELKNEYIKYFRNKFPELENDFYYFKENSITANSIDFIPFKYLKPHYEGDNIKTKEDFYKWVNFENEK